MGLLSWLFGKEENEEEEISRLQSLVATKTNELNKMQKLIEEEQVKVEYIKDEVRRKQSAASKKSVADKRLRDKGLI